LLTCLQVIKGVMFKIDPTKRNASEWNRNMQPAAQHDTVNIFIDDHESANATLVYANASRSTLFHVLPALRKFVDETGNIILPGAHCGVDEEYLNSVIHAALHNTDSAGKIHLEIEDQPMPFIKMHVILTLLEKGDEAEKLQDRLWDLLQRNRLSLDMVEWIWDIFGPHNENANRPYNPPFADFYVNILAWQLLNIDAAGNLDVQTAKYIMNEGEIWQRGLKEAIEERQKEYGLEKGYKQPQTQREQSAPNPFAELELTKSLKDEAKPQQPVYHAKNYMEQGRWKGRDLKDQAIPATTAGTPGALPAFDYAKSGTGLTASSFSKNANVPAPKGSDDDTSEDEFARLAALAGPPEEEAQKNPFLGLSPARANTPSQLTGMSQKPTRAAQFGQPHLQPRSFGPDAHSGSTLLPNPFGGNNNDMTNTPSQIGGAFNKQSQRNPLVQAQLQVREPAPTIHKENIKFGNPFGPKDITMNGGDCAQQHSTPASQASVNFGFGGPRQLQKNQPQPSPFGPGTKAPTFGHPTGQAPQASASPTAFGGSLNNQGTSSHSIFAAAAKNSNTGTPMFGSPNPAGNPASASPFQAPAPPQNTPRPSTPVVFGASNSGTPNIGFGQSAPTGFNFASPAFGAPNNGSTTPFGSPSGNPFASPSGQSGNGAFGSSNASAGNANEFGNALAPPQAPAGRNIKKPRGRLGRR
jgi:hypothetical protein